MLMGLDLLGFVDDISVAAEKTITANNAMTPNPAYRLWFRQDKLILHALCCSLSESNCPYLSAATTSRDAWTIIKKLYVSHAQSRIIALKTSMHKTQKGDHDVVPYVHDMKLRSAELARIGQPISDIDLVVHTLRGLGLDFNQFYVVVRARCTIGTIDDLLDSLIEYKADLKEQARDAHTVPTAYYSRDPNVVADPTPLLVFRDITASLVTRLCLLSPSETVNGLPRLNLTLAKWNSQLGLERCRPLHLMKPASAAYLSFASTASILVTQPILLQVVSPDSAGPTSSPCYHHTHRFL
ncbi:unnamed protein product [Linum trigynum]|uniref:Uncharacterized protein n=1 Tax=Linum trigynum TaxID=586398 RepID=A0AAV2CSE4_9ROSI